MQLKRLFIAIFQKTNSVTIIGFSVRLDMARVVYVWEMGGGYGHIARFVPVARELRLRGHEVIFVLKDLAHIEKLLNESAFSYLQAPVRWPGLQRVPPANSYAEILRNSGFAETSGLLARVKAWRTLFDHLAPDLLLFDHAPTALLAARDFAKPRALFGTGFFSPPRVFPMCSIRPWLRIPEKDLLNSEQQVLYVANAVLKDIGGSKLDKLADLFDTEEDFLCTFAELDHYPNRLNARYWDPILEQEEGAEPIWPETGERRVFVYLRPQYPAIETLLKQLHNTSWSILMHIPGVPPAWLRTYNNAHLRIDPRPLNMRQVIEQCNLGVCHGGAGTISAMLLSGKPLLLLPMHVEQALSARQVVAMGAGIYIAEEVKKPNIKASILEIVSKKQYAESAIRFAQHYSAYDSTLAVSNIADRCVDLLAQSR